MAKSILKATRSTCKETLYGDLGWQSIAAIQDCHRIKYLDRLLSLDDCRWPKVALNYMLNTNNSSKIRWKWIDNIKDILNVCNINHQILNGNATPTKNWSNSCSDIIKNHDFRKLIDQAKNKFSLANYVNLKSYRCIEPYLLDQVDFQGVNLKFKARSNTLPLNNRTCKWDKSIDNGLCSVCNNGIEDVCHFLFICKGYASIRADEFHKLEQCFLINNMYDVWVMFISGSLQMKLMLTLGNTSHYNHVHNSENISPAKAI